MLTYSYSLTWEKDFFKKEKRKTHPAVGTIHIPTASRLLEPTWLTFALESVQKSIIYPLRQRKTCMSSQPAAGIMGFWEPNGLHKLVWEASSLQLRGDLQTPRSSDKVGSGPSPLLRPVQVCLKPKEHGFTHWVAIILASALVTQGSQGMRQGLEMEEPGRTKWGWGWRKALWQCCCKTDNFHLRSTALSITWKRIARGAQSKKMSSLLGEKSRLSIKRQNKYTFLWFFFVTLTATDFKT